MTPFKRLVLLLTILLGIPCMTFSSSAAAEYDYIDITNPFLRKIPLAVPQFKSHAEDQAVNLQFRDAAALLIQTLEFTGYFKILPEESYLYDPQSPNIIRPNILFENWTGIGAELLVTGGMIQKDGLVETELRLFDTFKEKLIAGKKYTARLEDLRKIIRLFCSEIIFKLTGDYGYFDTQIAFVSNGTGNKEIYLCDFDGYGPEQFTDNDAITLFPSWSSDRQWISYTAYNNRTPDLYIRNTKTPQGYVVQEKGTSVRAAWVPGRFEMATSFSFTGDQEIYLLTGTGKIIKRLTYTRGTDIHPTWSPDGKRMAFVSKRAGTPQIFIKQLNTGQVTRLTFEGKYNTQPAWSPKGDKIAFSSMQEGQLNIWVIGVDGSGLMQLTRDAGENQSPTWSPDGSLIAFSSTREGPSRIYVMTAYGTDQRRLLALPGQQSDPAWSPSGMNVKALSGS